MLVGRDSIGLVLTRRPLERREREKVEACPTAWRDRQLNAIYWIRGGCKLCGIPRSRAERRAVGSYTFTLGSYNKANMTCLRPLKLVAMRSVKNWRICHPLACVHVPVVVAGQGRRILWTATCKHLVIPITIRKSLGVHTLGA